MFHCAKCKEKQMLTNTNTIASRILPRQRRDDQQVKVKKNVSIKIKELENGSNGCICVYRNKISKYKKNKKN